MYYGHIPDLDASTGLPGAPAYQQLQVPHPLVGVSAQQALISSREHYGLAAAQEQTYMAPTPWSGAVPVHGYPGTVQYVAPQWSGQYAPQAATPRLAVSQPGMPLGYVRPHAPELHQHHHHQQQQQPGPRQLGAHPAAGTGRVPATVEDMMVVLRQLHPSAPAIPAIAAGLRFLDSRALAALLKDLSKCRRPHMAFEVFDWLRAQDPAAEPQLVALLDVYTYTTMIAQCTKSTQLPLALNLVAEMRARGVAINNHTYSAVLNACVKSNELTLALEVFQRMLAEGLTPNIVTYNILLEVYAKKAMWQESLATFSKIQAQRVDPEVRTYTLVMLACNTAEQYHHTLRLFREMSSCGKPPNTGTYNAVILACCKLGEYLQAQEVYSCMVASGCECTHTTYILMLQAAEQNAQWQFALQLIRDMQRARVRVTPMAYSAAVGACIGAGQVATASQVLAGLHSSNKSGMVAPTHLMISLYSKCCDWRTAYQLYGKLLASGVRPDTQTLAVLIEALWQAGAAPTGTAAMLAFEDLCRMGLLRLSVHVEPAQQQAEFYLPVDTPAMVIIGFWRLCNELQARVQAEGVGVLRSQVLVHVGSAGQELDPAVAPMLQQLCETPGFPLRMPSNLPAAAAAAAAAAGLSSNPAGPGSTAASNGSGSMLTLHCSAAAFGAWLGSPAFSSRTPFKPAALEAAQAEQLLEAHSNSMRQCQQAYQMVAMLEASRPALGLPAAYVDARPSIWQQLRPCAAALQPGAAVLPYDALRLLDMAVGQGLLLPDHSNLQQLLGACLLVVVQSSGAAGDAPDSHQQLQQLLQVDGRALAGTADSVRALLQDTSLMSCYRVAMLLLQGTVAGPDPAQEAGGVDGVLGEVLCALVAHPAAAALPPSRVTALAICAARKAQAEWPWWPRALLAVTSMTDPVGGYEAVMDEAVQQLQEKRATTGALQGV